MEGEDSMSFVRKMKKKKSKRARNDEEEKPEEYAVENVDSEKLHELDTHIKKKKKKHKKNREAELDDQSVFCLPAIDGSATIDDSLEQIQSRSDVSFVDGTLKKPKKKKRNSEAVETLILDAQGGSPELFNFTKKKRKLYNHREDFISDRVLPNSEAVERDAVVMKSDVLESLVEEEPLKKKKKKKHKEKAQEKWLSYESEFSALDSVLGMSSKENVKYVENSPKCNEEVVDAVVAGQLMENVIDHLPSKKKKHKKRNDHVQVDDVQQSVEDVPVEGKKKKKKCKSDELDPAIVDEQHSKKKSKYNSDFIEQFQRETSEELLIAPASEIVDIQTGSERVKKRKKHRKKEISREISEDLKTISQSLLKKESVLSQDAAETNDSGNVAKKHKKTKKKERQLDLPTIPTNLDDNVKVKKSKHKKKEKLNMGSSLLLCSPIDVAQTGAETDVEVNSKPVSDEEIAKDKVSLESEDKESPLKQVGNDKETDHERNKDIDESDDDIVVKSLSIGQTETVNDILDFDEFIELPVDFKIPLLHEKESVRAFTKQEKQEYKAQGVVIREGRWTKKERDILLRNWDETLPLLEIKDPMVLFGINQGIKHKKVQLYTKAKHLIVRLAKGLSDRTLHAVYRQARSLLRPNRDSVNMTAEEVVKLKEHHKKHGENWVTISELMNKTPNKCRVAYISHQDKQNSGPWKPEEEENLTDAIKAIIGDSVDELSYRPCAASWKTIAKLVHTRNPYQCRQHWLGTRSWTEKPKNKKRFSTEAKACLIFILYKDLVEDAVLVDWPKIYPFFKSYVPSFAALQTKWRKIKAHFPELKGKPHLEVVKFLFRNHLPGLIRKADLTMDDLLSMTDDSASFASAK